MSVESIAGIGGAGTASGASLVDALYRQNLDQLTGAAAANGTDTAAQARGADFGSLIGQGLGQLAQMEQTTTTMAAQAATGDLSNIHDYVIAAASMQTATELTTTIRNKSLEAFNEIMRMQL